MQTQVQNQTALNASASVVQNDTIPSITVAAGDKVHVAPAASTYMRIEQLVNARVQWEQGALRTSNEQLYALLAKCYSLYLEMCGSSKEAKAMRADLGDFISKHSYRFLDSTHTLTKIVKCVFGVDRRRVSTYSLVLREALAKDLKADDVAAFITSKGGVEEIRRSKSKTAKTPKQKAELGKDAVSCNQLAIISGDKIAQSLDLANIGKDLVAIVTQQADGTLIVRKLISSQSVLNAALASAYSASKKDTEKAAADNKPANDDKFQTDLINKAAGM